jgi:hypothetical protein
MSCEFIVVNHDKIRSNLIQKMRFSEEVITYEQEPALASLCTSIALKFELERPEMDRLSPFWGIDPDSSQHQPYQVDIVMNRQLGFGLVINPSSPDTLRPSSLELRSLIHPDSIDESGRMSRVLVFPAMVAQHFQKLGFQLVIVRDWILQTALAESSAPALNYLLANDWEMESVIAKMQLRLMMSRQLPFFGTHDIVDHLFGADLIGYLKSRDFVHRSHALITEKFADSKLMTGHQKVLAYLLGVVLDDLAQPKWYGSQRHFSAVDQILAMINQEFESPRPSPANLVRQSWIENFVTQLRAA